MESVSARHPRKSVSLKRERKWILPTLCFPRAKTNSARVIFARVENSNL